MSIKLTQRLAIPLFLLVALVALSVPAAPPDPELTPSRIVLCLTADAAHSQAVTWRTFKPVEAPQGQIAVLTSAPDFAASAQSVPATAVPLDLTGPEVPEGAKTQNYFLTFENLQPATRYGYRVGDGAVWSPWNVFQTASDKPAPFRFLYFGDPQNDLASLWSRTARLAFQQAPDAAFLLFAGDIVNNGYDDALWGEFAEALGFISAMVPSVSTPGNHDTHRYPKKHEATYPYTASPVYHAHFRMPENGPAGDTALNQEAYCIDYQGVRFISVNSNVYMFDRPLNDQHDAIWDAQLAWLEKALAYNPNRWTIVTHHQPIYSVSERRDSPELREALRPLYDKYHVDLVLQGHDHTYGRTHKLANDQIVDPAAPGTIYAVSVSGPKMYDADPKFASLMAKVGSKTQLYQVVEVDQDKLTYTAYTLEGQAFDTFRLQKDAAGTSTYINE